MRMSAKEINFWLMAVLLVLGAFNACETAAIPEDKESENNTLTVALLIPSSVSWYLGNQIASAILPATEEVRRRQLLPHHDINWILGDTGCVAQIGFRAAIDVWQHVEDLDAIIGAACSVVCQPVSLLAAAWNIPIISYSCTSSALSNKDTYPTFTRVTGPEEMNTPVINVLMDTFGWDRCAVITTSEDLYTAVAQETKTILENAGKHVIYHMIKPQMNGDMPDLVAIEEQKVIIRSVKTEARLICLFMYSFNKRVFLLDAYDEGMINGEYIFFGNDVSTLFDDDPLYRPEVDPEVLLEGFLALAPYYQEDALVDQLNADIVSAFDDPLFDGFDNSADVNQTNIWAGFLHDAVLLWAYGVNRTLREGGAADDGVAISANIFNITIKGGVSGNISIDHKGDRKVDRIISIMQPGPKVVQLFHWHGAEGRLENVYHPTSTGNWSGLYWGGGSTSVPTGAPPCGWQQEYCPLQTKGVTSSVITGVLSMLGVVMLIVALLYLYKRQLEKSNLARAYQCFITLPSLSLVYWQSQDLEPINNRRDSRVNQRTGAGSRSSQVTQTNNQNREVSTADGMHHSETISIDRNEKSVDLILITGSMLYDKSWREKGKFVHLDVDSTLEEPIPIGTTVFGSLSGLPVVIRAYSNHFMSSEKSVLLRDICNIRFLKHKNLASFLGVSETSSLILIIREQVSRGSVRNLIDDPEIKFSQEMKLSFVTDITFGLYALHKSTVKYHGHLTSSNCVVDKRWVCKITDFGFNGVRKFTENEDGLPDDAKLWTAPEVLRGASNFIPELADIYSFGIIIQEVVMESLPFVDNLPGLTSTEIISRIKEGDNPPYRPFMDPLYHQGWINLASLCWEEDPRKRPSSTSILREIRKMNHGKIPDLVDMMVQNMEKHTEVLERSVKERHAELIGEQRRMDAILGELLPRSVLEQLKSETQVAPESFDEVSMFSSDIVGFTSVCAGSTPIQVVQMLNSLYYEFDKIADKYDVYKVATIGDAYIVASGVPLRNGRKHAGEIAAMSLDIVHVVANFEIPHRTNERLHIRIGLHTGPCTAGVTGTKTPRYLLFGETVEICARLEASGKAMRIHVSQDCAALLQVDNHYILELRGDVKIKGFGTMRTFWLGGTSKTGKGDF